MAGAADSPLRHLLMASVLMLRNLTWVSNLLTSGEPLLDLQMGGLCTSAHGQCEGHGRGWGLADTLPRLAPKGGRQVAHLGGGGTWEVWPSDMLPSRKPNGTLAPIDV